jgi:dolichyl-phosphate beta-glucosyltransferase
MATNKPPFLSVVIPSYNEKKNLRRGVLEQVVKYLDKQKYTYEVILSDDGSTDGTTAALEKFASKNKHFRVLANEHAGKGQTVTAGMLNARGTWRLFCDFDQSTPLADLENLLQKIDTYKVIIGSRALDGAKRDNEPFYRHLMGIGFNLLTQIIVLPGIHDSQCGFKLFYGETVEKIFPKLYVYSRKHGKKDAFTGAFDVEVLFIAKKFGYKIAEVPVHWQHNQTDRVAPIKDSVRMLVDILRIRAASLTGKYRA